MSAAKHTQGPWHVGFFDTIAHSPEKDALGKTIRGNIADVYNVCGPNGAHLAYVLGTAEDKVNALLISAAPELLEALWGCVTAIERTMHCTEADRLAAADKARAVIAKATGVQQ